MDVINEELATMLPPLHLGLRNDVVSPSIAMENSYLYKCPTREPWLVQDEKNIYKGHPQRTLYCQANQETCKDKKRLLKKIHY